MKRIAAIVAGCAFVVVLGSVQGCNCGDPSMGTMDLGDEDMQWGTNSQSDLSGIDFFQRDGIIVSVGDGGTRVCFQATCQGKLYACGDCMDNDGDGKVDADDPDCLGPCQNSETGFFGNIPGQN